MAGPDRALASLRIPDRGRGASRQEVGRSGAIPLPGLDPAWSQVVPAPDAEGVERRWHVLDNGPGLAARDEQVRFTLLCVHGNPTWSYLWRRVLAQAPPGWRVVAVDHLGMGWSERPDGPRTLAQRIDDLDNLTSVLALTGPVATLAHDWGGPISLGWAQRHLDDLVAVVLTNTAVHQPGDSEVPAPIRVARAPRLLATVTESTPAFVRAATALSVPPLPGDVRAAFAAPYASTARRSAVGDFVRDIPLEAGHPSRPTLDAVAAGTATLHDRPALVVWGARDPVFRERYLEDLLERLPHADVHRYADASHLVLEDRPGGVEVIWDWLRDNVSGSPDGLSQGERSEPVEHDTPQAAGPLEGAGEALASERVDRVPVRVDSTRPDALAIAELGVTGRRITFAELAQRVDDVALGLAARGVAPGDRVALLVPPGIDLTTVVYAVWRLGAVIVVADAGLGLGRLGGALRSAGPRHVVGIRAGLALARATQIPGTRFRVEPGGDQLDRLAAEGRAARDEARVALPGPDAVTGDRDGAVLFTSGATGPPKGVVYTRDGIAAQVGLLRRAFGFGPGERFVAAFAPFALYGPALGLSSAVPDMDVSRPHTLTASGLADAVAAVDATMVFAAPAALRNVLATADQLTTAQREVLAGPRLVLSAGAPVPVELLRELRELLPSASTQTPYGMTEALPVASHDPTTMGDAGGELRGTCVGPAVEGVQIAIAPLDDLGVPGAELVRTPGVMGEIVVRGPHVKNRYDRLWATQRASARPPGWHRTGDVGSLDEQGRLWVEGRLAHTLSTPSGPLPPYAVEHRVRALPAVSDAVVVGVGPAGNQQAVVIVVPEERLGRVARRRGAPAGGAVLARAGLSTDVRTAAQVPVAAVLVRDWVPVDVRHASKVDRTALADWADRVLHGRDLRERLRGAVRGGAPRRRSR